MLLLLIQDHFPVEKMHEFDIFNDCVTQQTDQPTDRRTAPIIEMRGRIVKKK